MKSGKLFGAFLIVGFLVFSGGCHFHFDETDDSGCVLSRERELKDFYGVTLEGAGNVNIYLAEDYRVVVTTGNNNHDIITTKVHGNKLCIDEKRNRCGDSTKLTVDIYMPELNTVSLQGVGTIRIINGKTSNFEINLSGVGTIDAQNFEAEDVVVNLSGTGDIKTWASKSLSGKLSGIGDVMYKGMPEKRNVNRTGIGTVKTL